MRGHSQFNPVTGDENSWGFFTLDSDTSFCVLRNKVDR